MIELKYTLHSETYTRTFTRWSKYHEFIVEFSNKYGTDFHPIEYKWIDHDLRKEENHV